MIREHDFYKQVTETLHFLSHIHVLYHPAPAVVPNDTFWNFGAKEKPVIAVSAFWKRDNSINCPFSPQSGEHRVYTYCPGPIPSIAWRTIAATIFSFDYFLSQSL